MKKINFAIGIALLSLVGCTATQEKQEPLIKLPTVPKQASTITNVSEGEFVPQTDIIHPTANGIEQSEAGITEIKLNNVDQVSIAYK